MSTNLNFFSSQFPILMGPVCEVGPDQIARLHEVLGWVRDYVKDGKFVAGTGHLTLADICFVATYSTLKAAGVINLDEVIIPDEKYLPSLKPLPVI